VRAGRWALGLGITAAGLGALWGVASGRDSVEWVDVRRGDLVRSVRVEGSLKPVDAEELGPPATRGMWDYRIARMAAEGEEVEAGTAVLSFDASELEKRLLEKRAELDAAEKEIEKKTIDTDMRREADELRLSEARAKLEKARLKLERPAELVAAKETKTLELDRELAESEVRYLEERRRSLDEADRTDLENLREQRDRARSRVREIEETIARMTLAAPRDGTVVYVSDRRGEKKRVGDSVWRHEKVLAIPDLSRMMARGFVDESDAGKIRAGQSAEIRLDAYPEVSFRGSMVDIGKTILPVSRSSPLRGIEVELALEETDVTRMRPDMRFRGTIEVGRLENVLLIPLRAVDGTQGRFVVHRPLLAGEEAIEVTLGERNDELVEVVAGLSEGERIVVRDPEAPR
jgi:HlyD family secretion protein/macrolide-specific efflux system membrane fusion protein